MTKDQVIKFRDQACKGYTTLIVTCDNMMVFSNATEFLIWDDDNECLYAIRANTDHYHQDHSPMEVSCTLYEHIQYIECHVSGESLKTTLDEFFVTNNLIDETLKAKIIEFNDNICNKLL